MSHRKNNLSFVRVDWSEKQQEHRCGLERESQLPAFRPPSVPRNTRCLHYEFAQFLNIAVSQTLLQCMLNSATANKAWFLSFEQTCLGFMKTLSLCLFCPPSAGSLKLSQDCPVDQAPRRMQEQSLQSFNSGRDICLLNMYPKHVCNKEIQL